MKNPVPVALITGGARRIGAEIARSLHASGYHIALHCHHSRTEAETLVAGFNRVRRHSAHLFIADLIDATAITALAQQACDAWGRLDALVNNASAFYPTPIGQIDEAAWDDLVGSNLKAPLFLSQALAPHLAVNNGSIVNLADIHASRPLPDYVVYGVAKAGLVALTRTLARELAPAIRVNAIAPGTILWPEQSAHQNARERAAMIEATPLKRIGTPADIAAAVRFLLSPDAAFITGQVLSVDGGRGIGWG